MNRMLDVCSLNLLNMRQVDIDSVDPLVTRSMGVSYLFNTTFWVPLLWGPQISLNELGHL